MSASPILSGPRKTKYNGLKDMTNRLERRTIISKQSRTGFKTGGESQHIEKGIKRVNAQSVMEDVIELLDPQTHTGDARPTR